MITAWFYGNLRTEANRDPPALWDPIYRVLIEIRKATILVEFSQVLQITYILGSEPLQGFENGLISQSAVELMHTSREFRGVSV